jgi:hypothetical protein
VSDRRRQVRVTQQFFDRLDDLLPQERSAAGAPSTTDFLLHDLPRIIDRLAEGYENSTLVVDDAAGTRVMITAGMLVPFIALYTALNPDGSVEIYYLDIDWSD